MLKSRWKHQNKTKISHDKKSLDVIINTSICKIKSTAAKISFDLRFVFLSTLYFINGIVWFGNLKVPKWRDAIYRVPPSLDILNIFISFKDDRTDKAIDLIKWTINNSNKFCHKAFHSVQFDLEVDIKYGGVLVFYFIIFFWRGGGVTNCSFRLYPETKRIKKSHRWWIQNVCLFDTEIKHLGRSIPLLER